MARCSIIIPVFNKVSLTLQCLDAVLARTPAALDYEIIVVDDGSTDATQQLLAGYGERVRVVEHAQNTGFATACNDGAALARGDFLVFLNNDTIPRAGWLAKLVRYAEEHPAAAVVGSKLLFPNETVQHAGVVVCQDRYPRHLYAGFPADHPAVNKSRRFQIVTAACALVRRPAFERVGGFEPIYRNCFEDIDLCLRLGELGYEVHYCHESVLYHLESVTEGRFLQVRENDKVFRSRWFHRIRPDDLGYYVEDGLLDLKYWELYPVHLALSPLLAVLRGDERQWQADRLLDARSRQVFALLKDNIRLNVSVQEANLRVAQAANGAGLAAPSRSLVEGSQLLSQGEVHWLSHQPSRRLISVIIPVASRASRLGDVLARVYGQRTDDSIEVIGLVFGANDDAWERLRRHRATVIAVDARSFAPEEMSQLACQYARGELFIFLSPDAVPADDHWLENLVAPLINDSTVAAVCGRVLPEWDSNPWRRCAADGDPDRRGACSSHVVSNRDESGEMNGEPSKQSLDFHTVNTAVLPKALSKIPFRSAVGIGKDVAWAKEVVEAGFQLRHAPSSAVQLGVTTPYLDLLRQGLKRGTAEHQAGERVRDEDVVPDILRLVGKDWGELQQESHLGADELEARLLEAALRRAAELVGHWLGANRERIAGRIALSSPPAFPPVAGPVNECPKEGVPCASS